MKPAKKSLFLLIAVLLFTQLLTACAPGGGEESTPATSTPIGESNTDVGELSFTLPDTTLDFNGRTITIASIWANGEGNFGNNIERGESAFGDLWLDWRASVEKKYNCKIQVDFLNANDTQVSMINKFLAGEKVADIINCQMVDVERTRLAGDFLLDLNTVSSLDLQCAGNTTYGKNMMEACTWKGKTYAVNPSGGNIQEALIVNMDLLESLKLDFDPWELVEKKEWNFESFRKILEKAKKDINGDGKYTSKDQYGTYASIGLIQQMALNGGVRALKKNADGTCEYTLNTPNTVKVVNDIKALLVDSGLCPEIRLDGMYARLFRQGQIVMMPQIVWAVDAKEYLELDFNMGLLPIPLSGEGTEYCTTGDAWMAAYCIPKLNTEPEYAGVILQSLLQDFALKQYDLDLERMANTVFPNHEPSIEVYKMLQSNIVYTLAYPETGWADAYYAVLNGVTDSENPITAQLEAVDEPLKAFLKDTYNKAVQ